MLRLPDEVREEALAYAYEVFDRRRWEQVSAGERGAVFDEMVIDVGFSEPLRPFLTPAQMRVWLKDSAAKEYSRALEGIGPTARYTKRRYPGPDVIVRATLGNNWSVVPGSVEQKPMRCRAVNKSEQEATLTWGSYRGLRDLHWAASIARVSGEQRVAVVITRPTMAALPADQWARVESVCALIGVDAFSVMYAPRAVAGPER
ncbi:hypothetical protein [Mycobacterium sp. ITM-2016-00318]|uniref:hypothetical protein n=1 Tax=Mycobacterium sp. ITM-2016-00318 TaxID=2099693 RepID=UPI000CF8E2DA|nr:hypothetical protein [Mycobacterium sp. ITM-2016-00318]WNG93674.1 hypothetical protein C6A82_004175 [Mycobacterium sp. ITM-2016-00318]